MMPVSRPNNKPEMLIMLVINHTYGDARSLLYLCSSWLFVSRSPPSNAVIDPGTLAMSSLSSLRLLVLSVGVSVRLSLVPVTILLLACILSSFDMGRFIRICQASIARRLHEVIPCVDGCALEDSSDLVHLRKLQSLATRNAGLMRSRGRRSCPRSLETASASKKPQLRQTSTIIATSRRALDERGEVN